MLIFLEGLREWGVPSIQVAFQGGGARFVEMLPIAHALAKAQSDGLITITRVAGSSAGSICAALIACNADFVLARKFIQDEGHQRAVAMRTWYSSFSSVGALSPVNWLRATTAIFNGYRGKALLRPKILVTFLNDLFARSAPQAPREIEGINALGGTKLLITGSDLSLSRGVVFDSGNLIERIGHSTAIPFAFRTFIEVVTAPYVDGGLCENLPVEQLLAKEDFDGPVFCVSIDDEKPEPYVPSGVTSYCLQLISASMNHNVDRSKRLVGLSNQFEEKSSLKTFDFEAAIAKLSNDDWYDTVFERTTEKIHKIAQLYQLVGVPDPSKLSGRLSAAKIMHSLFKVFQTSLRMAEWEYMKSAFVVRADCLQQLKPNQIGSADYVVRIATIRAKADNLVCFSSSAILNDRTSIIPTAWTCYNETQARDLRVQAIPVKDPTDPAENSIGVLIFFEDPLSSVAKGDILTIKSHFLLDSAMLDLHRKGSDFIRVSNPHSILIRNVEVVLVYPSSFGTISAVGDDGIGTPMSTAVVQPEHLANLTPMYQGVGYTCLDLAPNGRFRVNFFRNAR